MNESKPPLFPEVSPRINEAKAILQALGLPKAQQNKRSALTLLALANVAPGDGWRDAKAETLRTVDIMFFIDQKYNKKYAPNSRETIRRQTLHQFMEACVVDLNPDDPARPTNSGNNCYALTDGALVAIRAYGTGSFEREVETFVESKGRLRELRQRARSQHLVPIEIPDGTTIELSPGKHNELQKAIIEEFGPRFAAGARLLYLGDTAKKHVIFQEDELRQLSIPITEHDKLPDVVLYLREKNWLFLIEAVTSHGPVSFTRHYQLSELIAESDAEPIFVSAFPDRAEFRRHVADIAWETEVWLSEDPDHLVHFNGDKFLGPHAVDVDE